MSALKEWLRYKWEVLRDDPEYKKAYKEILPLRKENKYTLAKTPSGASFLKCEASEYSQEEIDYCHYFEVDPPLLDPDLSFEELINPYYGWYNPIKELTDTEEKLFLKKIAGIAYNNLIIEIDFTKVNSISALNKLVINLIKVRWLQFKEQNKNKTINLLESYDKILFVGRLKENNPGMSWTEIARRAFPNGVDQDSARVRANQHYKRYLELINGGWRELKFP